MSKINIFSDFINFNSFNDQLLITVKIGNQITQQFEIQSMFAQQQFMQLVEQVANKDQPIEVKCSYTDYTEFDKEIINSLAFRNNTCVKFMDEFERGN